MINLYFNLIIVIIILFLHFPLCFLLIFTSSILTLLPLNSLDLYITSYHLLILLTFTLLPIIS